MKQATITLWGKYKYKVRLGEGMTMNEVAMAIALEVHRAENKTKFTVTPRTYNYILECLLRKSCLNFRVNAEDTQNNEKQLLEACNELNNKSEFVKKVDDQGIEYYEHQDYRLGYTQSNTLIIDIDGKDEMNLKKVFYYYQTVLQCKFKVFRTNNGYWLFSDKKYKDISIWLFDHCRVLCPSLEFCCFEEYRAKLLSLDEGEKGEFQRATPEVIKASGLYRVPKNINFDVAFTFLSIKRERSTIRITKKHKNDKIEQITI